MPKMTLRKQTPKKGVVVKREFCSICLSDIEATQLAKINVCDHVYCKDCILKWSEKESKCPLCRAEFTEVIHKCRGKDKMISITKKRQGDQRQRRGFVIVDDDFVRRNNAFTSVLMERWRELARQRDSERGSEYVRICKRVLHSYQINRCRKYFWETNHNQINVWDIPHSHLYDKSCRKMVIVFFLHNETFRHELIEALNPKGNATADQQISATMILKILNRFFRFSRVLLFTTDDDTEGNKIKRDFKQCRIIGNEHTQPHVEDLIGDLHVCTNVAVVCTLYKTLKGRNRDTTLRFMREALRIQNRARHGETNLFTEAAPEDFPII